MRLTTAVSTKRMSSIGDIAIKERLVEEIEKSVQVISRLDDTAFRRPGRSSSIGAQFRHNLDVVNTFLNGVRVGRIDYTRRERDARVERDRYYAIERFDGAMSRLLDLSPAMIRSMVSVRSEIDPSMWLASTAIREMEYVLSHTIHHHALIAERLAGLGLDLESNFGVAPSTRDYWSRMAA